MDSGNESFWRQNIVTGGTEYKSVLVVKAGFTIPLLIYASSQV
jgi:hypothetical protein